MTTQYVYFIIFACLAYLIVTDQSVAKLFVLLTGLLKFQYQKYRWIIMHHPKTPWARYIIWRRSWKLAEELQNEIKMERQSRESNDNSKIVE
jgi:hypothetical protein